VQCASLYWRNYVFALSFVSNSRKPIGNAWNVPNSFQCQCHMEKKDFWVAFPLNTWLTWVEDYEHSGHTSTDCNDENDQTVCNIVNKAQCSILELTARLSFPYGTSLREDLKHEAYVCQVCAPIAYWITKSAAYLDRALGFAGPRSE
jgi:hypothetical protein